MDTNPYAPPAGQFDPVYFATEARNATFRELWRMTPPTIGGKLLAILVKTLRLTGPPQIGVAFDNVVRCSPEDVPELHATFDDTIRSLKSLSFYPTLAMKIPVIGNGYGSALALLGRDPTVFAIVMKFVVRTNGHLDSDCGLSFMSRDSATIWATSNVRQRLDHPPIFKTVYLTGSTPDQLHTAHCQRLKTIPTSSLRRFTTDVLWDTLRENESLTREFNLERGVIRPMTVAEVVAVSQSNTTEPE